MALVALPLGALGLYLVIGSPGMPGEPLAARLQAPPEQRSLATLIGQVEAHLARNPEDGRGWEVLAPVYMRLGRFEEAREGAAQCAAAAWAQAPRAKPIWARRWSPTNGIVTAEAKASFERALALDAKRRARTLLSRACRRAGRPRRRGRGDVARAHRRSAGRCALGRIHSAVAGTRRGSVGARATAVPGPTEQDMAAAADLAPQQRSEMVRGMVERLAERLKRDGSDVEGWIRLVRAYTVLGERDKARDAASQARQALEGGTRQGAPRRRAGKRARARSQ